MKDSCLRHPAAHPLIIVRRWQVDMLGGVAEAALASFFEYWHNIKLSSAPQSAKKNAVAERHGDEPSQDTSLYQHHTEQELVDGIIEIAKKRTIPKALKNLVEAGLISIHKNPNPKYSFDQTNHFLFHPEVAQKMINEWIAQKCVIEDAKMLGGEANLRRGEANLLHDPKTTSKITSKKKEKNDQPPRSGEPDRLGDFESEAEASDVADSSSPVNEEGEYEGVGDGAEKVICPGAAGGSKKKGKKADLTATAEAIIDSLDDETLKARFFRFWDGYKAFCKSREANPGSKKEAAIAWIKLANSNFNNKGLGEFSRGVYLFVSQQGDSKAGIPHGCRFLYAPAKGSGAWEDAIEAAEPSSVGLGDFSARPARTEPIVPDVVRQREAIATSTPPPGWGTRKKVVVQEHRQAS